MPERHLAVLLNRLTIGRKPQSFLGARWVRVAIGLCPSSYKPALARRLLALSPHYIYTEQQLDEPRRVRIRKELERNDSSRRLIVERLISRFCDERSAVLDLGCGPGFAARHLVDRVDRVYACDLSPGVIACAEILNPSPRIHYFDTLTNDYTAVPDASLDLVYSIAVIQHVTDEVFDALLAVCWTKLKPGATILLHMPIDQPDWRSEAAWKSDASLSGRVRWRYGLNCFGRDRGTVGDLMVRNRFSSPEFFSASDWLGELDDDVTAQTVVIATKPVS